MRRLQIALSIGILSIPALSAQQDAVRIHVVDLDSAVPILRARVVSASTIPLAPAFTDEHGDAAVEVPGAARIIRVIKPGYVPRTVPVAGAAKVFDVRLARGAAVSGRVVDTLGAPVVGRAVIVGTSDKQPPPQMARTNDLGEYRVGTLPDGTYTVSLGPAEGGAAGTGPADALPHTVVLRRGEDVGGIDFSIAPGVSCRAQDIPPLPGGNSFGSGSIRGRVTGTNGRPLPCVNVVAFRGVTRISSAVTDVDGRYTLRRLPWGAYPLEFTRAGYVTLQWGQQRAGQPGRPVAVREREELKDLDVSLPRGGAITGTLVDEFGEPVEGVLVRALQLMEGDDRAIAVGPGSVPTDDRGRYRIFGLLPGRYIVATAPTNERPDLRTGRGYAPAYYPGTVEIAATAAIDVEEERERPWTDFARVSTRVATVTGTAVNSRDEPITDRVILVASQRSGAVIAETHGAEVKGADGAFSIPNVPPGDYVLQATSKRAGEGPPEFGMQYVTVYEDDPPPARVKTSVGTDVQGRLIEEGGPRVDPRSFALVAVPLNWDQTSLLAGPTTMTPMADGSLSLIGVTGSRRFVLTASPSNWYLKSIRIRGREIADSPAGFPMLGFIRDLEIVVSNNGAILEGDAMSGSNAADDYSVVLFSSNPDHWFRNSRMVKATRADDHGRFRVAGIADGEYWVVAVDPLNGTAAGAWQEPEFLRGLTIYARKVRLHEGEDRTLSLTVAHH